MRAGEDFPAESTGLPVKLQKRSSGALIRGPEGAHRSPQICDQIYNNCSSQRQHLRVDLYILLGGKNQKKTGRYV
jgi:hypothetical protein